MRVRVLPFGVSKDWLGPAAITLELAEGALVADLLEDLSVLLASRLPAQGLRGMAVSVNAEYARADDPLSGTVAASVWRGPRDGCGSVDGADARAH